MQKSAPVRAQVLPFYRFPALLPAASRNVFAHLVDLTGKTRVAPVSELGFDGGFTLSAGS